MPQNKIIPINYTSRDYITIREDLMELAERFYPDNFQDWSEGSFGSMMIDAVAYVGDQLSFYLDYNVNESFLDTAYGLGNIIRHGRALGYKDPGRASTYGELAFYIEVPASPSGLGPDSRYIPVLKKGSRFSSTSGQNFLLTANVDFANPANPVVVSKVTDSTGAPTHYAYKAYGTAVSGRLGTTTVTVGSFQKFRRVLLPIPDVAEIISVTDSSGEQYFEVENLAQDIVYREIANKNFQNDNVPSILKPLIVNRKFVLVRENMATFLQFGSGDAAEIDIVAEPQQVALDIFGKNYVSSTSFDPTRLSKNRSYGLVPTNTKLTVTYRVTNSANSNAAVGSITRVSDASMRFANLSTLAPSTITSVRNSLECSNESPIMGDITYASTTEIKQRIYDTFPTQNRAVTQADYENIAYRMAPQFGSIKRCSVQKDTASLKRNLNMYVISEDVYGKLIKTNSTIKNNLKTWLNNYRMINDTVDIQDAYVINLGLDFSISVLSAGNKEMAMAQALATLRSYLTRGYYIGEQFSISQIYSLLKSVPSVLDVKALRIFAKTGAQYSNIAFSVNQNTSPDGSYIICPKNAIFEIKYPQVDIKGKAR